MTVHNVEQNTEDWQWLRLGRVGGSECAPLLVNGTNATGLGAGAITLLKRKVAEIITSELPDSYSSDKMEEGKENEPLARKEYAAAKFTTVNEVGYISKGDYFGYSPDGLVSEDGLIEIKCPSGPEFVGFTLKHYKSENKADAIKKEHLAQMNWGMWLTGRKWCDLVVYNPWFPNKLIITRVYPDPDMQERFKQIAPVYVRAIKSALNVMRKKRTIL